MIDWTLNVGTIVQIVVLLSGIVIFTIKVKGDVSMVKTDVGEIKGELKELRKVLTTQVDHEGRLDRAEEDIRSMRGDIKELRHGEGFVFPLKPVG
jgi:ArsR family metal-binding transcriptional regulator